MNNRSDKEARGHRHGPLPEALGLDDAQELARQFATLADPSRIRIVAALISGGSMCVSDVAATVELSDSATSHQLSRLRDARIVAATRQGREVWYEIRDAHVRLLLDLATEHYLKEAQA